MSRTEAPQTWSSRSWTDRSPPGPAAQRGAHPSDGGGWGASCRATGSPACAHGTFIAGILVASRDSRSDMPPGARCSRGRCSRKEGVMSTPAPPPRPCGRDRRLRSERRADPWMSPATDRPCIGRNLGAAPALLARSHAGRRRTSSWRLPASEDRRLGSVQPSSGRHCGGRIARLARPLGRSNVGASTVRRGNSRPRVIARPRPGQRSPNAIPTPIGGTSPPRDTSSIISNRSRCQPGGCGRRDPRRRFRRPGALPALSHRRLGNRATAGGRAIAIPRTGSRGATRSDESNGDRGDVRPWLVKPQAG